MLTNTLLQGRYQLEDLLGQGGMGAVYRGYDTALKRPVAIKLLSNLGLGTDGPERLMVEAQAVAQLNDPHIVAIYDVGWADQDPFIVMELVEGQSLRRDTPFTLDETVAIGRQICQALDHAHSKGIIHRDLKPENIILTTHQTAKLMDFGLARMSDGPQLTQEGAIMGTVNYMAPELLTGQVATTQSDLYALGLILYEMSAGRPPFSGENLVAILAQHLHSPVTPPSNYNPAIPPALDALILKLLEKEPVGRPAQAAEVEQVLARIAAATQQPADLESPAEFSLLDRIVRGRLVGRQTELAQLQHLWQMAWQGQAHLALVSGEPGAGKTRLASELLAEAQLRGVPVLRGSCYEYEAITPYQPFIEALRDWVHRQPTERLHNLLGLGQGTAIAAELARLAPEIETRLGSLPANPPLPPEDARSRLFDYLALFLSSLAADNGLILFIDDLHWTDTGTLKLLHYLVRRLRHERLLILANYREVELDRAHPLAAALVSWNRERLATRLALGRLSEAETGAMLAAIFSQERVAPEFAAAIYRETDGNPFFIEEVVKALIDQGQIYRQDGRWTSHEIDDLAIPQSVKEAVGRRLDRLSPECMAMLYLAALLGKQFAFSELAAVGQKSGNPADEEALLDLLDEAVSAQLLRPLDQDRFAFTHDKIREVLVEEQNPIRRRRLHQRIGQTFESIYAADLAGHIQALAYHFIEAGDLKCGLAYCQQAGEQAAALFSLDEATRYYEQARECAEALGQLEAQLRIDQELGRIHHLRGTYPEAIQAYERALALAATPQQRASLKGKIGGVIVDSGDSSGSAHLVAAIEELDPNSQPLDLAEAYMYLGRYHHYQNDYRQAITNFEKAQRLAEPLGDLQTLTILYAYLAGAYQHQLELARSMALAWKLVELGQAQAYPPAEAVGYEFLAEDSILLGRWSDALDYAARDEQIGEKIGAQDRIAWAHMTQIWSYQGMGQSRQVVELAPSVIEYVQITGSLRLELIIRYQYCLALVDLGDLGLAEAQADLLEAGAATVNQQMVIGEASHARMAILSKQDRWSEILPVAEAFIHRPDEVHRIPYALGAPTAAEALIQAGALAQAEAVLEFHLARAQALDLAYIAAIGRRVLGQLRLAQGKVGEALSSLNLAIETLSDLGARPELVHALHQRGLAQQALGDQAGAAADLLEAETLAAECGMVIDQDKARTARAALVN